jgi:phage terminase large subunit GpA-like protein
VPTTDTPGRKALRHAMKRAAQVYRLPPHLTISEWADTYRRLSPEASASTGQWVTLPYQKEPMDALCDPLVQDVVMVWPTQSGKTEILLNIMGYYIHQDPSPILLMEPTLDMAETLSKDRFAPMIRDSPALRDKISDPKSRDSGNTLLHKKFTGGGHITFVGANSPASLAMRPIRILLCDEVAHYNTSAGTEGDPVSLVRERTENFWSRKRVYLGSPKSVGDQLDKLFSVSDMRRFHVPCPHCGEFQILVFKEGHVPVDYPTGHLAWEPDHPETAYYICVKGCVIEYKDKAEMIELGEWRPDNPISPMRGYWMNRLYTPWTSWEDVVNKFLLAKHGGRETLKVFVNTSLAEAWKPEDEVIDSKGFLQRLELYQDEDGNPCDVPQGGIVLTAGVDVQRDRIEVEVVAWGCRYEESSKRTVASDESWSVEYMIFMGETDPEKREQARAAGIVLPNPWEDLDLALRRQFRHASGVDLRIIATMVDSGDGVTTHQVYRFVGPRKGRGIWACKGMAGAAKPIVNARPTQQRNGAALWTVGVDTAKEQIYSNLQVKEFGPGYCHFPKKQQYDAEHFEQLTGEKIVTKMRNNFPYRVWEKRRARNEALDCRVYAMAALEARRVDWERAAESLQKQAEQKAAVPEPEKIIAGSSLPPASPAPKPSRQIMRNSWVNRW